jgi:large subunit ribosomal protein L13
VNSLIYKTKFANKENHTNKWYLIDAEGEIVGRLASEVAKILRGKNKPDFTPHFNSGDSVVVINAEKVRFTGNKLQEKSYKRYSGYPNGLKTRTAAEQLKRKPEEILKHAVSGMLPKNKLQKVYLKNLHIFPGAEHPHQAQQPVKIEI